MSHHHNQSNDGQQAESDARIAHKDAVEAQSGVKQAVVAADTADKHAKQAHRSSKFMAWMLAIFCPVIAAILVSVINRVDTWNTKMIEYGITTTNMQADLQAIKSDVREIRWQLDIGIKAHAASAETNPPITRIP